MTDRICHFMLFGGKEESGNYGSDAVARFDSERINTQSSGAVSSSLSLFPTFVSKGE